MQHRLNRRAIAWLPIVALALAGACKDAALTLPETPPVSGGSLPMPGETRSIAAPYLSTLRSTAASIATCGNSAVYNITAKGKVVGTVTVGNDASNIYVTYATPTEHWWVSDTRLAIATTKAGIPQDASGNPSPWDFPYAGVHEPPVTSYTFTKTLSSVGGTVGGDLYISAMAGVVHPVDEKKYDGAWEWMIVWGASSSGQAIQTYRVASCGAGTVPPPTNPPPPSPPNPTPTPAGGGLITITFDDGWKTTYDNAYPVLRDLGLRGNVGVNPDPIDGGYGDYMTLANLQALKGAGWSIVSHTMSHRDLTSLSATELDRELRESQSWVAAKGFGPTNVFIVPFHSWGSRERTAIAKYYKYARGYTIDQFNPARFAKLPITTPLDLTAFEPEFAPFTTATGRSATMANVKRAVDNGEFLDLMFHKVTPAQIASFKELMTSVAAYKSSVKVWGEVAQ